MQIQAPATLPIELALPPRVDPGCHAELLAKISNKTAQVAVVGMGYVGLPLANAFIDAGFGVLGYDIDQSKVDRLNRGESYVGSVPSESLQDWLSGKRFDATSDSNRLGQADAVLICVPTPLDAAREPDLSYVRATVTQIASTLRPGQLIVLESTTYPSTTRDVVVPLLEQAGLCLGREVFVAYSPEREDPGNPDHTAARIPKVVGGLDPLSQQAAVALYEAAMARVVRVSSCEVAEACKILENTYRAVNIAMINEMKMLCDRIGIDVWEVIEAAKTKPFGFAPFYPGPGLGGHCIPIDPFYMSWLARKHGMSTRFIELAGEVNSSMPDYVVKRLVEALNNHGKPVRGSRVAILGVAYKRDIDDPRESPSFVLLERLGAMGAELSYNDPYIPVLPSMRHHNLPAMQSQPLSKEFLESQDCVLIATDHSDYDYKAIVRHAPLVVDTRNATAAVADREHVVRA